jgi:hypothetical protein
VETGEVHGCKERKRTGQRERKRGSTMDNSIVDAIGVEKEKSERERCAAHARK